MSYKQLKDSLLYYYIIVRMPSQDNDVVSVLSDDSNKNGMLKELKNMDQGFYVLKRLNPEWVVWANERRQNGLRVYRRKDLKQFFKLEVYSGKSFIRNAITGQRSNCKVGSRDEDSFFSVIISTGEHQSPITLFYNTTEEYERHHRCILNQETKERWYQKNFNYRREHNFE